MAGKLLTIEDNQQINEEMGDGRIGRLLISLLTVHWNLFPHPLLYLSAYFEKKRDRYYDLLLAVS